MYTIDDYRRLPTMPAAEAPIDAESREAPLDAKSWAEALYHPDDSDNDLRQDIRATGMDGRWSMSSEVAVRRIWKQSRRFLLFLCFLLFSSHLFSSSLLWISARYKWRRHGILLPTNVGGISPCARSAERSPLSFTDRLWDLWVRTIAYIGWLFHSLFAFPSLLLYWLWQPRRSAPNEGDNVTATRDPRPGKRQYILVAATALRSVSNILPLYSPYILTRSRVQPYTTTPYVCGQA